MRPRLRRRWAARLLSIAVCLTAAPRASAQDFFEIVDVPLVEVDVLVTDAQGRPLVNLRRESFTLLVDGEEQEVSFFAAPAGTGTGGTVEGRSIPAHLVLLVDNENVERQRRNQVLEDFREFLMRDAHELQRIMVVTLGQSGIEVQQDFTSDPALIDAALERVTDMVARDARVAEYETLMTDIQKLAGARDPTLRDSVSQTGTLISRIIGYSDEAREDAERVVGHLGELIQALDGLAGRRSILYVGGALSVTPGEALLTALKGILDRSRDGWARRASANLPAGVGTGSSAVIDALSLAASLKGVAIYSVLVGGGSYGLSSSTSASNLTAKDSSSVEASGSWSPGFDSRIRNESRSGLDKLAMATGGFVHAMVGRVDAALEKLGEQMAGRYVLGFHPAGGADSRTHEIEVRVADAHSRVHHRGTFQARSWDQETAARLRSVLLFGGEENVHGVSVEARRSESSPESELRIPLTIRFPLTSLSLEPIGGQHRGQASVFVTGSGAGRLEVASPRKSVLPVVLQNDELSRAVGRPAEYRLDLEVPAGARYLAVAVRDDLSTELSTVRLQIPGSQTVLLEPSSPPRLDELTADQTAPVRLPSAALLMSGQQGGSLQIEPGHGAAQESGGVLRFPVQGWLEGADSASAALDLEAHAYLLDADGDPLSRASRRLQLDLTESENALKLYLERTDDARSVRLLVRDLRTNDFGLLAVPLPSVSSEERAVGDPALRIELTVTLRQTDSLASSQVAPVVPRASRQRGRSRVSTEQISGGLVEVLELAANGDAVGAQDRLRDLEIEITRDHSPMAVIELGKRQARVLESMADDSWERLLPLAMIWGELIQDYHRRRMGPLSEHAIAMSTQLATIMARRASTAETRAEAADLLLSLSGHLLYMQRLAKTEQLLELAAKVDPDNGRAVVGLAATREQRGNYQDAIFALRRVPEGSPAADEGRLRRAVNLQRLGQSQEAETELRRLVEGAQGWVAQVAVQELARLLAVAGRGDEAVPLLRSAIEAWPENQALKVQLAWLLDLGNARAAAGDLAAQVAQASASLSGSPRFRYHRWYAEGLTEVRETLARRSSVRAAEAFRDLAAGNESTGGS